MYGLRQSVGKKKRLWCWNILERTERCRESEPGDTLKLPSGLNSQNMNIISHSRHNISVECDQPVNSSWRNTRQSAEERSHDSRVGVALGTTMAFTFLAQLPASVLHVVGFLVDLWPEAAS